MPVPFLPDEVLATIFKSVSPRLHFSLLPLVSWRWRRLSASTLGQNGLVALEVHLRPPYPENSDYAPKYKLGRGIEWFDKPKILSYEGLVDDKRTIVVKGSAVGRVVVLISNDGLSSGGGSVKWTHENLARFVASECGKGLDWKRIRLLVKSVSCRIADLLEEHRQHSWRGPVGDYHLHQFWRVCEYIQFCEPLSLLVEPWLLQRMADDKKNYMFQSVQTLLYTDCLRELDEPPLENELVTKGLVKLFPGIKTFVVESSDDDWLQPHFLSPVFREQIETFNVRTKILDFNLVDEGDDHEYVAIWNATEHFPNMTTLGTLVIPPSHGDIFLEDFDGKSSLQNITHLWLAVDWQWNCLDNLATGMGQHIPHLQELHLEVYRANRHDESDRGVIGITEEPVVMLVCCAVGWRIVIEEEKMTIAAPRVLSSTLFAGDPASFVFDISLSPDGFRFAASGRTSAPASTTEGKQEPRRPSRIKKDIANIAFHNPHLLDPAIPRTDFILVYDAVTLKEIGRCSGHVDTITDLSFSPVGPSRSESLLVSSSRDGTVQPLMSHSLNCNGQLLAAGTEKVGEDARIRLWDVRQAGVTKYNGEDEGTDKQVFARGLVGDFADSHGDDITQVRFHPTHPLKLLTGGTDGIFNIFHIAGATNASPNDSDSNSDDDAMDTSSPTSPTGKLLYDEDESIAYTTNADSVHRLAWFGADASGWYVACLTHVETIGVWNEEVDSLVSFGDVRRSKDTITGTPAVDYLVGTDFDTNEGRLRVIGGSNE
ncbi:WD repeat-containing protein 89 [Gonapodya sp. JEL0774]|nr:WD repeat-containing protein 89 [Gonapodya sp. JEL0774]